MTPVASRTSTRIANAGLLAALMVVFIHVDISLPVPRMFAGALAPLRRGYAP